MCIKKTEFQPQKSSVFYIRLLIITKFERGKGKKKIGAKRKYKSVFLEKIWKKPFYLDVVSSGNLRHSLSECLGKKQMVYSNLEEGDGGTL